MHLHEKVGIRPFQIRPGDIDVRTRDQAGVDHLLEVEVGVGLDAAGGAHGGDARREIHAGRGERHLRHQQRCFPVTIRFQVGPRDVKQVIVHTHDAGHHGVSAQVEHGYAIA